MRPLPLAACLVLCTAPAAAAPPSVDTPTLSMANLFHDYYWIPEQPVGLQVLATAPGATTITTPAWAQALDFDVAGTWRQGDHYRLGMELAPKAGYVITGFTFSATLDGSLWRRTVAGPGIAVEAPAVAYNRFAMTLPDGAGGTVTKTIENIDGATAFALDSVGLALAGPTSLVFDTYAYAETAYGSYTYVDANGEAWPGKLAARATIGLSAPTLTIHTAPAPIPEPATWAMLLAGLALGIAPRRWPSRG